MRSIHSNDKYTRIYGYATGDHNGPLNGDSMAWHNDNDTNTVYVTPSAVRY